MGRLEREIQNHPVEAAKSAFGPYLAWFALIAVFGWPFFVFHGSARLAVGIPWLIITVFITLAVMVGNRKKTPHAPAKMQQKAAIGGRDVVPPRNVSSAVEAANEAATDLQAWLDLERKYAAEEEA